MTQKANPVTLTLINLRRSRHHHPLNLLNLLNLLNPLNPHTEGVSNATTAPLSSLLSQTGAYVIK